MPRPPFGVPPSRSILFTAACTVAIVVVVGLAPTADAAEREVATITALEGLAEVVPPGSTRALIARLDMRVSAGSTVRTKANGRLELQFDDRSILRLYKNTEVRILSGAEERGVLITLGNIWAKIQSALGMSKFKIKTPTVVAGVRGTIVRAEVTEDEASIAVDEGEVEVEAPEQEAPVILKRNQVLRVPRGGRRLAPQDFDPQAREKWEFWTDPLVQQRIREIQEASAEVKRTSDRVHEQARNTFQALAVNGASVQRIGKRVTMANGLVDSVAGALTAPPPPRQSPGRRGGPRRGAPPPRPPSKPELLARLGRADRIYAETLPLLDRGRTALQESVKDVGDLRQALTEQQQALQELQPRLERFKTRREVDPHWRLFRPHYEESQGHHRGSGEALKGCGPLLSRQMPEKLGDDPKAMPSIEMRLQWGLRVLEALQQQIPQRQQQVKNLRATLNR